MKKRVKVFEAGKYGTKGEFSIDRVKKIFGDVVGKIKGAYIHTKTAIESGIKPVEIGNFSEFKINDNGVVTANIEFNEKGESYWKDGIMKGISVEINKATDKLTQIATLPPGVNPAVKGAMLEFSEDNEYLEIVEFEEMGVEEIMTSEEMKTAIAEMSLEDRLALVVMVGKSITTEEKSAFRAIQYEFAEDVIAEPKDLKEFAEKKGFEIEVKEKAPMKTESEIRAEVEAEFKAKREAEKDLAEFEAIVDKKVLPAHKEAYIEAYKSAQNKTDFIEFEKGKDKVTLKAHLKSKVEAMANVNLTEEFAKAEQGLEFSKTESQKRLDEIKKVSEDTEKLTGGRR